MALVRDEVAGHLRETVPALTLRLAPGLAFAEDPGGGESYGAHRCRLITEAVLTAWDARESRSSERLRHVTERFRRGGVDLARPYLGPGSPDDPRLRGDRS